jgi:hypothetical protein
LELRETSLSGVLPLIHQTGGKGGQLAQNSAFPHTQAETETPNWRVVVTRHLRQAGSRMWEFTSPLAAAHCVAAMLLHLPKFRLECRYVA